MLDGKKAMVYDGMPHGTTVGSPTENLAIRRAILSEKIDLIEKTAYETDPDYAKYIVKGVTDENATFTYLKMIMGIPCSDFTYYERRRKFFWLLDKKIENLQSGTKM